LRPPASPESSGSSPASLFPDEGPPHEKRILSLLKANQAPPIDEVVERMENDLSSSEISAARFELELSGKVRQMPGKNFCEGAELSAIGHQLSDDGREGGECLRLQES
jgi:DNA processing protein